MRVVRETTRKRNLRRSLRIANRLQTASTSQQIYFSVKQSSRNKKQKTILSRKKKQISVGKKNVKDKRDDVIQQNSYNVVIPNMVCQVDQQHVKSNPSMTNQNISSSLIVPLHDTKLLFMSPQCSSTYIVLPQNLPSLGTISQSPTEHFTTTLNWSGNISTHVLSVNAPQQQTQIKPPTPSLSNTSESKDTNKTIFEPLDRNNDLIHSATSKAVTSQMNKQEAPHANLVQLNNQPENLASLKSYGQNSEQSERRTYSTTDICNIIIQLSETCHQLEKKNSEYRSIITGAEKSNNKLVVSKEEDSKHHHDLTTDTVYATRSLHEQENPTSEEFEETSYKYKDVYSTAPSEGGITKRTHTKSISSSYIQNYANNNSNITNGSTNQSPNRIAKSYIREEGSYVQEPTNSNLINKPNLKEIENNRISRSYLYESTSQNMEGPAIDMSINSGACSVIKKHNYPTAASYIDEPKHIEILGKPNYFMEDPANNSDMISCIAQDNVNANGGYLFNHEIPTPINENTHREFSSSLEDSPNLNPNEDHELFSDTDFAYIMTNELLASEIDNFMNTEEMLECMKDIGPFSN